jgi:hypothetical protein
MFKKIIVATVLVAVIGMLVFGAVNRTLAKNGSETINGRGNGRSSDAVQASSEQTDAGYAQGQGNGGNSQRGGVNGNGGGQSNYTGLPPAIPGDLSADETAALLYMREEEKLAHDVYVTLYERWSLPIFQNISQSEQTHTEAVKTLLDRYGLADPASSVIGIFTNPDLQALYKDLTARGNLSLADALKVGAAIEEIDILDLEKRLSQTDNADIQQVFNNLMQGSYNHLRRFASTLTTQTGETYQPQYLSAQAYQAIIDASLQTGGNGRGGGQGGGSYKGGRP